MKLYCISGLGVNEKAFKNFAPKGFDLRFIKWISPKPNESIKEYSNRIFETQINEEDYCLLGLSFGGLVAQEIAQTHPPKKLFLISSLADKSEIPFLLRIGLNSGIHSFLPSQLFKSTNSITTWFFGIQKIEDKNLLHEILGETNTQFLKWALSVIKKWKPIRNINPIRIHGANDKMIKPRKQIDTLINGGHFMIVSKGKEISDIFEKYGA
ncbi:MAG: alpha/beta hydrolase [Crocinitomicaceae bacterium]|jgi:pimeloyl-ACP methyl ester carboxylesterase|nr:alpha/beta hydrolase [Crocinitomicaceae bacterium]